MGRTQTESIMQAMQDVVSEEVVMLVGDRTVLTAEAKLRKGVMVTTPTPPPPTKRDRECGTAVRTVRKEVFRSRRNGLIGRWVNEIFVRSCRQALTVRTCHRALTVKTRHQELTVWPFH